MPCSIYSTVHYLITVGAYKHYTEYIPAGYPVPTPWSRETIVDKMPCVRAYIYTLSGIQTHDPLITTREHEPLCHCAPIKFDTCIHLYKICGKR